MAAERRILLVAGEPSGDRAAATVVSALKELRPAWRVDAVGGAKLEAAGAEIILPYGELTVMGFAEVLGRLPALRRHLKQLNRRLGSGRYDLFLPVDFPGFNLRLAARAHSRRVPVLYFIAPQVWAWGRGRVAKIRRRVRQLAVILPFEEEWFRAEGIESRFVGHPIMEEDPPWTADEMPPRLGLLPGSRAEEVRRHLPLMLDAARLLAAAHPDLSCELLESPGLPAEFYRRWLDAPDFPLRSRREPSTRFLAEQGAVMVGSGTATLEAAVAGVPMAVLYRTSRLSYWLARRLVQVDRVALVNLVADAAVVPEFIQAAAIPQDLADAVGPLLAASPQRREQRRVFKGLRADLGGPGCGERVAALAIEILEGNEPGILARG